MHYLLFYDVVPDYLNRRTPFRAEHLAYCLDGFCSRDISSGRRFGRPGGWRRVPFSGELA